MAKSIKKVAKAAKKNPIGTFTTGVTTGAILAAGIGFIADKVAGKVVCTIRSKKAEEKKNEEQSEEKLEEKKNEEKKNEEQSEEKKNEEKKNEEKKNEEKKTEEKVEE